MKPCNHNNTAIPPHHYRGILALFFFFSSPLEPWQTRCSPARSREPDWEVQQRETFIRWINSKLSKTEGAKKVETLKDLSDGVALCQLMQSLFPDTQLPRWNKQPKLAARKKALFFSASPAAHSRALHRQDGQPGRGVSLSRERGH